MGAQNGLIGNNDLGVDIPEQTLPKDELLVEKSMASFATSQEYKRLKEHLEDRIAFYQTCLPDGSLVSQKNPTPTDWQVANAIIAEFKAVLMAYEAAKEAVSNAQR